MYDSIFVCIWYLLEVYIFGLSLCVLTCECPCVCLCVYTWLFINTYLVKYSFVQMHIIMYICMHRVTRYSDLIVKGMDTSFIYYQPYFQHQKTPDIKALLGLADQRDVDRVPRAYVTQVDDGR